MLIFTNTDLGDGATEIGVRRADSGALLAVITHPCAGAKWFVHYMDKWAKDKFASKKKAMQHLEEYVKIKLDV